MKRSLGVRRWIGAGALLLAVSGCVDSPVSPAATSPPPVNRFSADCSTQPGCLVYPMDANHIDAVSNALATITCPEYVNHFLDIFMYSYVGVFDGNYNISGDAHVYGPGDLNNEIHLWTGIMNDPVELGRTLVEESLHSLYAVFHDNGGSNDTYIAGEVARCAP